MGTSICHILLADDDSADPGHVRRRRRRGDPGLLRIRGRPGRRRRHLRAGSPRTPSRRRTTRRRGAAGVSVHDVLAEAAASLRPGESGSARARLVERQPVRPRRRRPVGRADRHDPRDDAPEIYRALIEATAFGTRRHHRRLRGRRRRDRRCRRLRRAARSQPAPDADLRGRHRADLAVAASSQTPALGSAMFAAVAAGPANGGYATIEEAAGAMAHLRDDDYDPRSERTALVYDRLYAEYVRLHDLFGRGGDPALKTLKRLRTRGARLAPERPSASGPSRRGRSAGSARGRPAPIGRR